MKKLRNFMLAFLVLLGVVFVFIGVSIRHYSGAVSKESKEIIFTVPEGSTWNSIGKSLKEEKLIKSETFLKIYVKLMKVKTLKQNTYRLNQNMDLDKIIVILSQDEEKDDKVKEYIVTDEFSMTFQEGINMRKIAKIISEKTEHSYDDVMSLVANKDYIKKVIDKYWFISDTILDSKIYYPLEGYLYPDTYRFNKNASIEDIFNKMIDEMAKKLEPYKDKLKDNKYNVHQILTIASMAEMEVSHTHSEDRPKVARVFYNRLSKGMALGSDVTTRYSLKIDESRPLTKKEYDTCNAYNTRCSSFTGLPAGPISTISESSIKAAFEPAEGNYIYFISNIKTGETFFYDNYNDFIKKKNELSSTNGGY